MNDSLDKVQVLVIDCQTTGGKADDHHLVEIGWVAIRAGDVIHGTLPEPDIYLV